MKNKRKKYIDFSFNFSLFNFSLFKQKHATIITFELFGSFKDYDASETKWVLSFYWCRKNLICLYLFGKEFCFYDAEKY